MTSEPTAADPIEAVHEHLGQQDPVIEGQAPEYAPWFGGAYGVPEEPGVVVVAVTDTCLVDPDVLEDIVGEGRLRLIEVPLGFEELNRLRSELGERLAAAGVPAALPIDSTVEGRIIRVTTPDPRRVPDELLASVPEGVVTVREGELDTTE